MTTDNVATPHPWLSPIEGDAPAGRDARHEPEHESVRAEIQKLGSLQGGTVDWKLVEQAGSTLLASKSKDLLIASYVAYAMFERTGLPGCMEGLSLLSNLLAHFGDTLHPLRPRARANAIEWFGTNLSQRLQDRVPDSLAQAEELRALNRTFIQEVNERLGEHAPNLAPLRTAVDRVVLSAPEPPPAAAPASEVAVSEASSSTASGPAAGVDEQALAALLTPISAAQPSGEDTSYADEHVAVRDEVAKLENAASGLPNWGSIAKTTDMLLRTRSKDLGLSCYYAVALAETQGAAGLLLGLRCVEGVVRDFWDTAWPPLSRVKRRAGAIEWLVVRAPITMASWSEVDAGLSAALGAALADLEMQATARFGATAPVLRPLAEALAKLTIRSADEGAAAAKTNGAAHVTQEVPSANGASASASALPAPAIVGAPQSSAELSKFLDATGDALVEASAHLRAESVINPRAYELLRTGVWLGIDSAPPADVQGATRVPAPQARLRESMDGMIARQEWADLLTQAEGSMPRSPFWLDLQRYSALALTGLGSTHASALAAVEREARSFAARIPALLQLKFADGTPFAQPDTARWLSAGEGRSQSSGEASGPALPDGMSQRLVCGEPAAVTELHELLRTAGSGRRSFCLRLELATLLEATAHPETVIALYLSLERDIDAHGLAQWEPALATEAFAGLRRVLRREADSRGGPSPELQRVCARLAQLTPGALL